MKKLLLILSFSFSLNLLSASDTLSIDTVFWHKDEELKIILINQSIEDLKTGPDGIKYLRLDMIYKANDNILHIDRETSYNITGPDGDYQLFFTSLPILRISSTKEIVDEPKVGALARLTDTMGIILESALGIEFRGGFSQTYPKKSYGIEFWHSLTEQEEKDVTFFNMREDGDWILMAMYKEPLRGRNVVNHALWQKIHSPYYIHLEDRALSGVRTVYIELFINNRYQGIYALTERIDRKQIRAKKYDGTLRGEIYKAASWDGTTFYKIWNYNNSSPVWGGFELEHPKPEEIIDWSNFYSFVKFVVQSNSQDFFGDIINRLHIGNAVDYFIFLNLMCATDNTGKNMFWGKYDINHPYFIIPWDFDGTYGMVWDGSYDPRTDYLLSNGLYDRLLEDCSENGFSDMLRNRWQELKADFLNKDYILEQFDHLYNYLNKNNAYLREELVWREYKVDYSFNMNYLDNWLTDRFSYLDSYFDQICSNTNIHPSEGLTKLISIYPNPVKDEIYLNILGHFDEIPYYILDANGKEVSHGRIVSSDYQLNVESLPQGIYYIFSKKYSGKPLTFIKY